MGLFDFLSRRKKPNVTLAYTHIMAKARQPHYYGVGGVPDSFDGRFDLLAVHVHLVLRRLRSEGVARDDVGQAFFDLFFRDMDQSMREAGIGDMGVGKKIRKMAQAFYGRAAAYDEAIGKAAPAENNAANVAALQAVLLRNLYPEASDMEDDKCLASLASDLLDLEAALATRSIDDILTGRAFEDEEQRR